MPFYMGNGGAVVFDSTEFDVQSHTCKIYSNLANTTHSGTDGWEKWTSTTKGGEGSFKAPYDGTMPDIGDEATGTFQIGSSNGTISGTLVVQDATFDCDNTQGVVMISVSFKFSEEITITAPTSPPPPPPP